MSRHRFPGLLFCAALLLLAGASALLACGPFFPNQLLIMGDRALLTAPTASFYNEMHRMRVPAAARFQAIPPEKSPWRQTIETDLADLEAALKSAGVAEARRKQTLKSYRNLCEDLRYEARLDETPYGKPPPARLDPATLKVPAGLPGEFESYIRGAILWRQVGKEAEARKVWEQLLAGPQVERRNRSIWAAFMIGRSLLDVKDDGGKGRHQAIPWFEKVRALAAAGYPDSLGLAAASFGWQAQAELREGRHREAIHLYLEQLATGDGSALGSLQTAAARVLDSEAPELEAIAADPAARAVVTAYIVSRGGPSWSLPYPKDPKDKKIGRAWLAAVEKAGPAAFTGADRMAAVAYQVGDMALAERWLKRAPEDSALANWLRAKLLMRAGKLDEAAGLLAKAVHGFPQDERWHDVLGGLHDDEDKYRANSPLRDLVRGELGTLQLARRHYVESLDELVKGGYRLDAAYVAERVLKPEELIAYVEANWPEPEKNAKPSEPDSPRAKGNCGPWLRRVLARRLARAERWTEARKYFPEELRPKLDELSAALRNGRDRQKPRAARAEGLWKAAQVVHRSGMELLGTEREPDWNWAWGNHELEAASRLRAGWDSKWRKQKEYAAGARLNAASDDERERLRLNEVVPEKRFHYRYIAANLAWEAAKLMPDESEATAQVLCKAGSWLSFREPEAADRFYKTLVRRCGTTALGREAEMLRWFPRLEEVKR